MRDFLHLLRSDWRRLTKTPSVPLLWLAFPIFLSLVEYLAFGQVGKSGSGLPKGTLLVVDRDKTTVSDGLKTVLQREPMSDFFTVVQVDSLPVADQRLIDNQGTASLILPRRMQDSLLTGGGVELVLTPNPREIIRPQMVKASLETFLEIGNRFLHESDAAISRMRGFRDLKDEPSRTDVMAVAGDFYDVSRRFEKLGRLRGLDLRIVRPTPKPEDLKKKGPDFNFFAYFLPGLTLMSAFFVAQGFERRNFRTRLAGMARRVSASPVRPVTLFAAESASILLAVLVAAFLLLLFGALLFHISLHQPGVLVLTLVGFGLFAVGLLKTLYGASHNLRTAESVGSVVIMLSMLLGGAFAPVEVYPGGMQQIAAKSPVGSASSAMVDALVHGKALAEAAPHVLGIWAWAVGLCVAAVLFARRSHARA